MNARVRPGHDSEMLHDSGLPRCQVAGGHGREDGVELLAVVIERGEQCAGQNAAARNFDSHRTDEGVVDNYFKMHMRPGGEPGRADEPDDLPWAHVAAEI